MWVLGVGEYKPRLALVLGTHDDDERPQEKRGGLVNVC